MRDTARVPQPPTDPPTGHRISLHGLAHIDQKCQIWAKFGRFWEKNPFVNGANDHYTRGYNFPIGTTPKKFSVSELGVIFWGSPLFLAVFGHWRIRRATTLNFGPISTKLGGIVRAIKKNDPEGQRTRSGPELRRNGRFYVRPKSGFWPKNGAYPKKSPKMTFSPLIIWAKALFFLWTTFFRSWPEHG